LEFVSELPLEEVLLPELVFDDSTRVPLLPELEELSEDPLLSVIVGGGVSNTLVLSSLPLPLSEFLVELVLLFSLLSGVFLGAI
jgi:hypothetical protein